MIDGSAIARSRGRGLRHGATAGRLRAGPMLLAALSLCIGLAAMLADVAVAPGIFATSAAFAASAKPAAPAEPAAAAAPVTVLRIDGAIGPATAEYVERGLARATADGAQLVVLEMDTPGGLDGAMRRIIKAILASEVPVATFVAPGGARAASAGTYILYASHVAAMAPGTNLGAATPVQIGGAGEVDPGPSPAPDAKPTNPANPGKASRPAGSPSAAPADRAIRGDDSSANAMRRKVVNDAAAYIRGLAALRGRNAEWAERAVREAVSLSAEEARAQRVVDLVADDVPALLRQLDGRTLAVPGRTVKLHTAQARTVDFAPDWRIRLLGTLTDPAVALLLMTVGVYGLLFELYSPGAVAPGVIGATCLIVGLYALQLLPVNYAGLALLLLGLALMGAEAFVPSFGALGVGGIAAFVVGAVILIDTDVPGFGIPVGVVLAVAAASAIAFGAIAVMALKTRRRAVTIGSERMIGATAEMLEDAPGRGWARIHGETWWVVSQTALHRGQRVRVLGRDGLVLTVAPIAREEHDARS